MNAVHWNHELIRMLEHQIQNGFVGSVICSVPRLVNIWSIFFFLLLHSEIGMQYTCVCVLCTLTDWCIFRYRCHVIVANKFWCMIIYVSYGNIHVANGHKSTIISLYIQQSQLLEWERDIKQKKTKSNMIEQINGKWWKLQF